MFVCLFGYCLVHSSWFIVHGRTESFVIKNFFMPLLHFRECGQTKKPSRFGEGFFAFYVCYTQN